MTAMTAVAKRAPTVTLREVLISTPTILAIMGVIGTGMIYIIQTNSTALSNKETIATQIELRRTNEAKHEQRMQFLEQAFHNLDKNVAIMSQAVQQQSKDVAEIKQTIKDIKK